MSSPNFHALAKDAGNRLKSYVLAYASGATGVFFLSLSNASSSDYSTFRQRCLVVALVFFVSTIALCLYELHIDARRFFNIAIQSELPEEEQSWAFNEHYKKLRVKIIYVSYITVSCVAQAAQMVVTFHGQMGEDHFVNVGGLADELRESMISALTVAGFSASRQSDPKLQGRDTKNICNRGTKGQGLRLEISPALSDALIEDESTMDRFSFAVRRALDGL